MARIIYGAWAGTARPAWAGDWLERDHLMPGGGRIDPATVPLTDAVTATVGVAGAAAAATSVPVAALSGAIPSGTLLDFTGTGKFALLTAAAAAGATTLTVQALPQALVSGDVATYAGTTTKFVPAGTLVGRTWAESASGAAFGLWASGDNEVYLIAHDVFEAAVDADFVLYRWNSIVKDNFLPGFATLDAGALAAIRAHYQTTRGAL